MAIQNSTLRNRTPNWDSKKRYKVNESVNYNGATWQNATGTNSEPGVGGDWINISGGLGTLQGLKDVLEVDPLAEFDGGNVSIKIDADSLEATYSDGASNKSELQLYPDGTFYSGSERLIESGTKQLNLYNTLETWFSELATNLGVIIRRSFTQFLETGVKISSRTNVDGFGVIINTDNLTTDETVQFGVGGGTVAYEEMEQKNITFNDLDNNPYIKIGYDSNDDRTGVYRVDGVNKSSISPVTDFIEVYSDLPTFVGIVGFSDYSPYYTNNAYVQKKWVDDNFNSRLLKVITPTAPVTGTTAETVLYTWFVPADTFSTTDRISIDDFTCVSNGTLTGTSLARIRFNTTSTVDTSTNNKVFATIAFSAGSGDRYFRAERIVDFIGGKIKGYFNLAGSFTDTFSSVYTSNDFDTTVDNWFFFTIQPADVSNSIYMKNLIITK